MGRLRAAALCAAALAAAAGARAFEDVTVGSGLDGFPPSPLNCGTGLCAGDFDGDADVDLVVPDRLGHRPDEEEARRGRLAG